MSATTVHSKGAAASRWFRSSDGVRLHYLEAGARFRGSVAPTLVFVPGWTMPAWIWQAQIEYFSSRLHVLAFDPRGQGRSEVAKAGYDYVRRAADIAELLLAAAATGPNVVLVGWSLGVLEALQFVHDARQAGATTSPLRGLVLVDNSVGVGDPPAGDPTFFTRLRSKREATVSGFVAAMFKRPREPRWLAELTEAALRTPLQASIDLLRQPRPREFWRDALLATREPVLYAYTPKFAQQGEIVRARLPTLQTRLFAEAGHALFVDEAAAFNEMLERFVLLTVGPSRPTPGGSAARPPASPSVSPPHPSAVPHSGSAAVEVSRVPSSPSSAPSPAAEDPPK